MSSPLRALVLAASAALCFAIAGCAQPEVALPDGGSSVPPDSSPDCFRTHLEEAIELNLQRREQYVALGGEQAQRVSQALVTAEQASLVAARFFDARAWPMQRAGLTILCDEFVPMSDAPSFAAEVLPSEPPPPLLMQWDAESVRIGAEQAYDSGGFEGTAEVLRSALHRLEPHPDYLCMTRHVLESALRAANLAPGHTAASEQLGLDAAATRALAEQFLWLQLQSLGPVHLMDRMAAPLQAQGLPILCRDVPHVPPR